MVDSETILQKQLWSYRDEIDAAPRRNVIQSIAAIFGPEEAGDARQSLERLIYSHEDLGADSVHASLPEPVRAAISSYLQARSAIRDLNGKREMRRGRDEERAR